MLMEKSPDVSFEKALTAEPFVGDNSEGILIAGKGGFALQLLRRHIQGGASPLLRAEQFRGGSKQGEAEIAEQDVLVEVQQDVLGLDIAVDDAPVMGVLKGNCHLLDVGHCRCEWQARACWVAMPRRSSRCIVHDQKGNIAFHAEFQHAHDVWMSQANQSLCLLEEVFHFFVFGRSEEHFESGLAFKIQVFAEIDLRETSVPQMANEAIVPQSSSYDISHTPPLRCQQLSWRKVKETALD